MGILLSTFPRFAQSSTFGASVDILDAQSITQLHHGTHHVVSCTREEECACHQRRSWNCGDVYTTSIGLVFLVWFVNDWWPFSWKNGKYLHSSDAKSFRL